MLVVRQSLHAFFKMTKKGFLCYLSWSLYFLFQIIIGSGNVISPTLMIILNLLFIFFVSAASYQGNLRQYILFSVLIGTLWMILELITYMSFTLLHLSGSSSYLAGSFISMLLMFTLASVAGHLLKKRSGQDPPLRFCLTLLSVPAGTIFIIYNLLGINTYIEGFQTFTITSSIILLLINCIIFWVYDWMAENAEVQKRNLLYEQQLNLCNEQALECAERDQKISEMSHDIKNHLACLQVMLQEGSSEMAVGYIEELKKSDENNQMRIIRCITSLVLAISY